VVAALPPAVFWIGSLLRIRAARRSVPQRTLCFAVAMFAVALTLDVPAVYVAFDRLLGVPNLADLGEHICGVWGVAAILRLAQQILVSKEPATATATARASRVSYEVAAAGLATVALTVLFVLAPLPVEAASFTNAYGHLPEIAAYWMVTIAYFGFALAALGRLSLRYAGRAGRRSLRIGLRVLGGGVAFGVAYTLAKLAELAAAQLHADAARHVAVTTGHLLLWVGGLTMGAALLIPAFGRLRAVQRAASAYIALQRLRPLWTTLWGADPDILKQPRRPRAPLLRDLLSFWQPGRRLYDRVIDINDGLMALRRYVTDELADDARAAATSAGLGGPDRDAAADACWLAVAIVRKRSRQKRTVSAVPPTSGDDELAELADNLDGVAEQLDAAMATDQQLVIEVERHRRLARALHSPVVRAFAAEHTPRATAKPEPELYR
jgi:Family of unknown function (DUF6545)